MYRGLRQGDPLSPLLFVLLIEVLNRLLSKASSLGLFSGLKVGVKNATITHLQFADDTLLFREANEGDLQNLKMILLSFQAFSGLAVNYTKSSPVILGKEEAWAKQVAERLRCTLVKLPITYLGVPLGANIKYVKAWEAVIDKVQNRLNSWKGSCFYRGLGNWY